MYNYLVYAQPAGGAEIDPFCQVIASYWKYSDKIRKVIDVMEIEGISEFESALFSKYECDYFNYYLDKASFNNGLEFEK